MGVDGWELAAAQSGSPSEIVKRVRNRSHLIGLALRIKCVEHAILFRFRGTAVEDVAQGLGVMWQPE